MILAKSSSLGTHVEIQWSLTLDSAIWYYLQRKKGGKCLTQCINILSPNYDIQYCHLCKWIKGFLIQLSEVLDHIQTYAF